MAIEFPDKIMELLAGPKQEEDLLKLAEHLVTELSMVGNHEYVFGPDTRESNEMSAIFPDNNPEKELRYFAFHDLVRREHYSIRFDTRRKIGIITDDYGLAIAPGGGRTPRPIPVTCKLESVA